MVIVGAALLGGSLDRAWAAPCCSAGSALPALVTNDDWAQISVISSYSDTVMDAPNEGLPVLRSDQNADHSWVTRVAAAMKVADSWQLGVGASVISRATRASSHQFDASGMGDSDISFGYELLPEWNYSSWRPRGWLYLQTVFPTGQAIQDPTLSNPAEVRGQGVFQTAVGLALTKIWGNWDALLVPEVRRLYSKSFDGGAELSGAWGASLQLGGGYNWGDLRFGLRTQPVYQGQRNVTAEGQSSATGSKLVWNSGADVSYLVDSNWMMSISYSDQTLLGPARNTTLERGLGAMIQRKWEP